MPEKKLLKIYQFGFFGLLGGFLAAQGILANSLKFYMIFVGIALIMAILEFLIRK